MTTEIIVVGADDKWGGIEDVGLWRGKIEKMFIDIMVNEVYKCNMASGAFNGTHGGGCYLNL